MDISLPFLIDCWRLSLACNLSDVPSCVHTHVLHGPRFTLLLSFVYIFLDVGIIVFYYFHRGQPTNWGLIFLSIPFPSPFFLSVLFVLVSSQFTPFVPFPFSYSFPCVSPLYRDSLSERSRLLCWPRVCDPGWISRGPLMCDNQSINGTWGVHFFRLYYARVSSERHYLRHGELGSCVLQVCFTYACRNFSHRVQVNQLIVVSQITNCSESRATICSRTTCSETCATSCFQTTICSESCASSCLKTITR